MDSPIPHLALVEASSAKGTCHVHALSRLPFAHLFALQLPARLSIPRAVGNQDCVSEGGKEGHLLLAKRLWSLLGPERRDILREKGSRQQSAAVQVARDRIGWTRCCHRPVEPETYLSILAATPSSPLLPFSQHRIHSFRTGLRPTSWQTAIWGLQRRTGWHEGCLLA